MKKILAMFLAGCMAFSLAACGGGEVTTDAPPKTEAEQKTEYIQAMIADMDAAEKAGQLIMADFRTNADGTGMTVLSEEAKDAVSETETDDRIPELLERLISIAEKNTDHAGAIVELLNSLDPFSQLTYN